MSNTATANTEFDIPEINFDSGVLTQDLLRGHFAFLQQTIRDQMQILGAGGFGIVDSTDPATALTDSNLRPFQVTVTTPDTTSYSVGPGVVVTGAGDIAVVESATIVRLATLTQGRFNCICVRYQVVDSGSRALSASGKLVASGTVGKVDVFCVTESDYLALSVSERKRIVVVAGVYIDASTGTNTVVFSDETRAWLRPWFTVADTKHRSGIGSGTVTSANPHGTGLADLGVGDHRVFDLLTGSGMVVSRDRSIKGVPGTYCRDVFDPKQINVDVDGTATDGSFFGGSAGTLYVTLSSIPNTVTGARDALGYPVAVDWIAGTRVVVLYLRKKPTSTITISYTKTETLALTATTPTSVTFAGIDASDVVVSNGAVVSSLSQNSIALRRFGHVPRSFTCLVTDTGYVISDPSVVSPAANVTAYVGENLLTGTWTPRTRSRIGIGFHELGASADMNVVVRVVGTDAFTGATVSEAVSVTQTDYEDAVVPPSAREYDNQVHYTKTVFASVNSIVIMPSTANVAKTATATVYGKLDPAGHRFAVIATGFWDGREVKNVRDARRILCSARDGWFGVTDVTSAAEVLVAANEVVTGTALTDSLTYKRIGLLFAEDFREPRYLDADTTLWDGTVREGNLIPVAVTNSDRYKNVYRSRFVCIRKYETEQVGFIVFLHADDVASVASPGAVRVLLRNEGTDADSYAEVVLKQLRGDLSGRVFVGYTNANYRSAAVVVSGACRAVSVYFSNASVVDTTYLVTPTPKSAPEI
jgi:hypothetical protein